MTKTQSRFAFASLPVLVLAGCSSSTTPTQASSTDGGSPPATLDASAGIDSAVADAAPPPVAEPPWSGNTVEPGCTANGCIHSFAAKTTFSKVILNASAAAGNAVLNGVTEYLITYVSDGAEITGSVFVPDTPPPAGGYGVVVMNQFTSGLGASCAPSSGLLGLAVASPGALNGFLTIAPDATSYGGAPHGAYIEGKIAGRAALDAARAAFHTSQALGLAVARKAVVAGLSEGAYSTMAAATAYPSYANELEIRGFAAAEPPSNLRAGTNYDLNSTTINVVYDAMRLYSWQGLRNLSGGQLFQPPYDTEVPKWLANECVFNGADGAGGTLFNEFYEPADDGGTPSVAIPASTIFSSTFLAYAANDSWPADWTAEYDLSQTVPSGLKLPVLIFEGSADTTVTPASADAYVALLQAAGVTVDYRKIPGGEHTTTALSSFTVGQAAGQQGVDWITQMLAN